MLEADQHSSSCTNMIKGVRQRSIQIYSLDNPKELISPKLIELITALFGLIIS